MILVFLEMYHEGLIFTSVQRSSIDDIWPGFRRDGLHKSEEPRSNHVIVAWEMESMNV